ncbi:MAG: DUF4136 domain-containing protein [Chitinophagaceae bacterium]|nr:DUF4136 domain-containing protein [Chitinophagaceae bacterium]
MKRRNVGISSLVVIAAIVLAGCGVQSYVEKDPSVDLKNYKTFAWINERGTKQETGKSYKDFKQTYMMELVTSELEKNGWQKAKSNPDVLIDYDIMIENETRRTSESVYSRSAVRYFYNPYTGRINSYYYPSRYMGENNYTVPYKSGTITINIVDNESDKLVWQGWAETEVTKKTISKDDMEKIVKSIFKKLDIAKR